MLLIVKAAAQPLNDWEMTSWRTFHEMQEVLRGRLEEQLLADSGLSNADYTVLVALSEADDGRLRIYELGRRLGWEKSRLHHQLTRMCKRGLVQRHSGEGRAIHVAITRRRPRGARGRRPAPHRARPTPGPRPAHPTADRPARRHVTHDPRRPPRALTPPLRRTRGRLPTAGRRAQRARRRADRGWAGSCPSPFGRRSRRAS